MAYVRRAAPTNVYLKGMRGKRRDLKGLFKIKSDISKSLENIVVVPSSSRLLVKIHWKMEYYSFWCTVC